MSDLMISSKKDKNISYEILRVVSMLMVITLHYLVKGGLLRESLVGASASEGVFWFLEAACLCCVNVYVLLSGYFLTESNFKIEKVIRLWGQVLFYSILVLLVLAVTGAVDYKDFLNLHELLFYFCPVTMGHYWFATTYLIFYIVSPFLAKGIRSLDKKQHGILWLLMFFFTCVSKTVVPFELVFDDKGYGILWFIFLFVTASYIRLYGCPAIKGKWSALLLYVMSVAGIWLFKYGTSVIVADKGKYEYFSETAVHYNSIFVFGASIGLFMFFGYIKAKEGLLSSFAVKIAPFTFGVYLLHVHNLLFSRWPEWLKVGDKYGLFRPVHFVAVILSIFFIGIFVDFIRSLIFSLIIKLWDFGMKIYHSKQEVFDYLVFGFLATVVSWVAYLVARDAFISHLFPGEDTTIALISNLISWIIAVLFAYVTNRTFVFKSEATEKDAVIKEFFSFIGSRVTTFLIDEGMMFIFVDIVKMNDIIAKVIVSFVVIVLNYVFSKLFVFKNKKEVD